MSRACARPTARRSSGTMCLIPRTPWWSASSAKAASSSPSRTRRSSAPAAQPSTRCSDARATPGIRRLRSGGSTGGGAAALAAGEVWLAHGTDHAGSLRRPATYCSVVGLRPSAGRVTRGTANNLFAPLSVQGPMARTVADVALFLDAMAGLCPRDPLTFEAPRRSFAAAVADPGRAEARRLHGELRRQGSGRSGDAGDLRAGRAPVRGTGRVGRGGVARPRQHRARRFWRYASQHYVVDRELHAADPSRSDQAGHHLEHRTRPEADTERDRRGGARARRALPASGRVLRDL